MGYFDIDYKEEITGSGSQQIYPEIFLIVAISTVILCVILYYFYFHKKKNNFTDVWYLFRVLLVSGLIVFVSIFFYLEGIKIYLVGGSNTSGNWIFTLINSATIGMIIAIIGLGFKNKNQLLQFTILFIAFYLAISGLGFFGVQIYLNEDIFPFLNYNLIQTNGIHSMRFITYNFHIIAVLIFLSIFTEGEK